MLKLPELGFGGAPLAGLLDPVDDQAATETLASALDAGLKYFDTAPFYGFGLSERRIGDAVRDYSDAIVSTKAGRLLRPGLAVDHAEQGWPSPLPFRPVYDYSYDGIVRSHEDSLFRLGLDRIDILLLHDIGPFTHKDTSKEEQYFKDAMGGGYRALEELRSSGQVSAVGIGVNENEVLLRALDYGDWDYFLLAGRYTLLEQDALNELLPRCQQRGVKIIVGGPFNSGILVGGSTWNYATAPEQVKQRVAKLSEMCKAFDVALPSAALQFPLAHPQVSSVIPGARTPSELTEILDWHKAVIPTAFWCELKDQRLIHPEAPISD